MVPFAGWDMPVQYPDGVLKSHLHTREAAGLFDVSHMGQLKVTGKDRAEFVEYVTVADVKNLAPFRGCYSLIPNEKGGLVDDTIVTNAGDFLYVVVNAGCFDKDMVHLQAQLSKFKAKGKDVDLQVWGNRSLVALQGPKAVDALQRHTSFDLSTLKFFTGGFVKIQGVECYVQRSGYTGEDGFEISIPTPNVESITRSLLKEKEVAPIGLGARDSLRLEAGLSLYGHDLDETTTPKEANLTWTISERRQKEGGFIGADVILAQLPQKISDLKRRRIGLFVDGPPAREGASVHTLSGEEIGTVTSGTLSPILKKSISMAYVKPPHHKLDEKLKVKVRGKTYDATVTKLPFVPTKYIK